MKGDLTNPLVSINEGEYHIDVSEIVMLQADTKEAMFLVMFKNGVTMQFKYNYGIESGVSYNRVLKTWVAYKKHLMEHTGK